MGVLSGPRKALAAAGGYLRRGWSGMPSRSVSWLLDVIQDNLKAVEERPMTTEQANYLGSGDRLRVLTDGLARHRVETDNPVGTYVSQFDSPNHGRLVVVQLDDGPTFGFRLDEVELLARQSA